ncbi:MAG: hypothetical protein KKH25_04445, partial [Candidatus Omnitrophica bacterium]|nr:hypothetical protein [Candidatus Omnitrophota bacterium]
EDNRAWDSPALGKTIFSKTNDSNAPIDWGKDLQDFINKQIASQLVEEGVKAAAKALGAASTSVTIAGAVVTIAMEVIDLAINAYEKEEDKNKLDFTISGSGSVTYEDIWLKVAGDFGRLPGGKKFGNIYRTFLNLDIRSYALTALQEADVTSVYVDFYNHEPHDADDGGKWMPKRGFRIKEIYLKNYDSENIVIPENYTYPVIDITEVKPYSFKDEPLRLGQEQIIIAKFVNKGTAAFRPCKVRVITPDPHKSFDINLDPGYGSEYEYRFSYTFDRVGDNTFIFEIDPEGKLDEYIDLKRRKSFSIKVESLPDLEVELLHMPDELVVNQEASLALKVKNTGKLASEPTELSLSANNKLIKQEKIKALPPGGSETVFFKWLPKEEITYDLICEVDSKNKVKEYYEDNNQLHRKVAVLAPKYKWFIKESSLMLNPPKPKAGEEARIYFTVNNEGRSQENLLYYVLIDDKRVARAALSVNPGSSYTVGVAPQETISWKATGGRHSIKVILDPERNFPELGQAGTSSELILSAEAPMSAVKGVDFILDQKDIRVEKDKIYFNIYNRGMNPATINVDFQIYESNKDKPQLILSRVPRTFSAQSYETFVIEKPPYNSKIEVLIDRQDMVKEFDEKNNVFTYNYGFYQPPKPPAVTERASRPDLEVSQIVNLDRPLELYEERPISIGVGNRNLVMAKNVEVQYEFVNYSVSDKTASHGYYFDIKNLGSLEAEAKKDFSVAYKAVYPGQYSLNVVIDPKNKILETDDTYNNKYQKNFLVEGEVTAGMFFAGKGADLSIEGEAMVSNLEPPAGTAVNFEVTIVNKSDIEVWGADLDMFVDGELVSGYPLGTISANSSKPVNFSHTFLASGDYQVAFVADAKEAIPEKNEANNRVEVLLKVKPGIFGTGQRDLMVSSFSLSKSSCLQGEMVTAKATIKNVGLDPLPGILCTIGPAGSKPFYVKIFPLLDPQEEVEISTTLPALFAGDHTVEARVDGRNMIQEIDEDNNVMSASLHVEEINKQQLKSKATDIIVDGVGKLRERINNWLKGLGGSKKQ